MKTRFLLKTFLFIGFIISGCTSAEEQINVADYELFGEEFSVENLLSQDEMYALYVAMDSGDSVSAIFKSTVNSVCQKKGCWMQLTLNNEENSFVRFKDYDFFVPMDGEGAEAIVQGIAYKEIISVEELQHYAQDAGKSEEEIAEITEPETKYTFTANGVYLKKNEEG